MIEHIFLKYTINQMTHKYDLYNKLLLDASHFN